MSLDMVIGFIVGLSLVVGIRTIIDNKKLGIIQLILTFLVPILTSLWCLKKDDFLFGGSDFEFFIQTATVDRMFQPWIIFILYIVLILLISFNIVKIIKKIKN